MWYAEVREVSPGAAGVLAAAGLASALVGVREAGSLSCLPARRYHSIPAWLDFKSKR